MRDFLERLWQHRVVRFCLVGGVSTLIYSALYLVFRQVMNEFLSNSLALVLSAVCNTAMHRWFTFSVRGREGFWQHHAQGLGVFFFTFALTNGVLWFARGQWAPSHFWEMALLTSLNLLATVLRFLLFSLVFKAKR